MKNNKQKKGDLGQHWTPVDTAKFMVSLIQNEGSILEPSAGSGRFLDILPSHTVACEIDSKVINPKYKYVVGNFFDYPTKNVFDTIIGNPPYVAGKLLLPGFLGSWEDGVSPITANLYIHFIDKCLDHLTENGELIFIVPYTLLGGTSYGSKLRKKMLDMGNITHYYTPNAKWESANVGTCIFRFQKGLTKNNGIVITENGNKVMTESKGFIWMTEYESSGTFADHFDIMVGSVPPANLMNRGNTRYFKDGKWIMVDEIDTDTWPRFKLTPRTHKIFFTGGPTRKTELFWSGTEMRHISFVMIPVDRKMDTVDMAKKLNAWFNENAERVGLKKDGRFSVGVNQLKSMPFPKELL